MEDVEISYACVPGAGGDDAIACLRKSQSGFDSYLKAFCKQFPNISVLPVALLS